MSEEYLKFIKIHGHKIRPLTNTESELLEFLIRKKIGGFEFVLNLYRELTK